MKPAPFSYHAPSTVAECLELLAEHGDDAALIAGGQSLMPLMRFRLAQPSHVISIRGLAAEFGTIRPTENGVAIGACVTYAQIQRSDDVRAICPALIDTIGLVAHPTVRSRGTVCGNLCQADPASQLPALALVLDARFRLVSAGGERMVPAAEYILGPYFTARSDDELLAEVHFPEQPSGQDIAVKEVTRLRGGFPLAGIAAAITRDEGAQIESAALACFGVHSTQIRLPGAEQALVKHGMTPGGIAEASDAIDRAIKPQSDPFASEAYRRSAVRSLFRRALEEIHGGANTP